MIRFAPVGVWCRYTSTFSIACTTRAWTCEIFRYSIERPCSGMSCGSTIPCGLLHIALPDPLRCFVKPARKGLKGSSPSGSFRYVSARSADWLKLKCLRQQELVIGGYTAPQGSRERLGALLVGYYEGKALRYAGKVGTGYDRKTLEMLHRRLLPLHRAKSPFTAGPSPAGDIQWVSPKLVAQVGFSEWTSAGLLRHPRYMGLRDDKPARRSRREVDCQPRAS